MYLCLGGLGTLHHPYFPSITWGAALTLGTLLGGQSSHLNPALSLGMTASGFSTFSSLPARIVGQCGGALLAAITLLGVAPGPTVHLMMDNKNNTELLWAEPWFTLPTDDSTVYFDILNFTVASVILQMIFCASAGSALYHGISLATIITIFGPSVGAGLNPAREVFGRLVVSFYHWNWDIFFYHEAWIWIPIAWSFGGCLSGALIYWLAVEIPKHCEKKSSNELKRNNSIDKADPEGFGLVDDSKSLSKNKSHEQLQAYFESKDLTPQTIKKFCKKNKISTPELQRYLAIYQEVPSDKIDLGNGVTVKVAEADVVVEDMKQG